ncbi:hypothetical protein TOT_040000587 [Theileria orientalis strain Shintoku]|uniref:Uncharacterized protein n=1 Tax=Theileria orientalis strain Shintoku TaxID=869250 RepID=J4CE38_THEOR|nr:hypothetical protein TOT_040000587 [Theileria orientalis strain Shintoku]PVC51452.1 hypothetical protein MACL_00001526 [Theileria orientalis]BAM42217.1 hypothetical protein TOT_040000587 [Theileria orientalis strain Shintoku]|eukprot:XP_009692518.1 hypothetical protein TOT_040000587 [Theileria orientalis strain Shintoku]
MNIFRWGPIFQDGTPNTVLSPEGAHALPLFIHTLDKPKLMLINITYN